MTWNNYGYSTSTSNFNWQFTTVVLSAGVDVPEPGSLALAGIALAALVAQRRKKHG